MKLNIKSIIKEEISKAVRSQLIEGEMANIDLLAQEAPTFEAFVRSFLEEYSDKGFADGDQKELKDWLKTIFQNAKSTTESVITEATTKTILGIQFNVVPAQAGMKFEFKNVAQFRKSGVHVNQLVDEITKM